MSGKQAQAVQEQYEAWPYPRVPLLMTVRREDLWQLNWVWMQTQAKNPITTTRPRIWVTGCGTFQPYVIALANPQADIIATDISTRSLDLAERRCRFYGLKNVIFEQVDLSDPASFPQGPFDWIECYGVLMCLPDPQTALGELSKRLSPTGLLRAMVYPHFGRRRVFHIQRLARLLGLTYHHPAHPRLLQKVLESLKLSHPLRYAFDSYYDAQNPEGIVDAFLHAADRGFTGIQWAKISSAAGLMPAFFLHRPWGQPHEMMHNLGFDEVPLNLALHYLDVWQELRSNFIVAFKQVAQKETEALQELNHPLFDWAGLNGLPMYKTRLLKHAILGTRITSRTHAENIQLSGKDVRSLLGWTQKKSPQAASILKAPSCSLNGAQWKGDVSDHSGYFSQPRVGLNVPNPFYGQLFDAWFFHRHLQKDRPWPELNEEIQRWDAWSAPLEQTTIPWGLTPHATYKIHEKEIQNWLVRDPLSTPVAAWKDILLEDDKHKQMQVKEWAKAWPGIKIQDSPEVWRELWILLFSYETLFLRIESN